MFDTIMLDHRDLDLVYHTTAEQFLADLFDDSVHLILTSPPYGNQRLYGGAFDFDLTVVGREAYRSLREGGVMVWVVGDSINPQTGSETLTPFKQAIHFVEQSGFRLHDTMIWRKYLPGVYGKRYVHAFEYMFVLSKGEPETFHPIQRMNHNLGKRGGSRRRQTGTEAIHAAVVSSEESIEENVWDIPVGGGITSTDGTRYPGAFPEELAQRHIHTWTNPGDLVIDPFMGSGTTLRLAQIMGRMWMGCDVSEEAVTITQNRLQKPFTVGMFDD